MQTHALKPLALAVAAMLAAASTAHAADVKVTPPSGGGFVVQNPSAQALFSIDANGQLTIANLDPYSRQPAFKQSAVRIETIANQHEAAILSKGMRKF